MGIALSSSSLRDGGLGLRWRQAQDFRLDGLYGSLEVGKAGGLEALVGRGDEVIDLRLVLLEEGVNLLFVDYARALGLREDEIEEEEESQVAIKRNPIHNC